MYLRDIMPVFDSFDGRFIISLGGEILKKETDSTAMIFFIFLSILYLGSTAFIIFQSGNKRKMIIRSTIMTLILLLLVPIYIKISENFYYKKSEIIFSIEEGEEIGHNKLHGYLSKKKEENMEYRFKDEVYEEYDEIIEEIYYLIAKELNIPVEELYEIVTSGENKYIETDKTVEDLYKKIEKSVNSKYYKIDPDLSNLDEHIKE